MKFWILMLKINKSLIFVLIILVASCFENVVAQIAVNSPYSRFGVGDLATRKNTYNFSMGGIAYAVSSPRYVNPYNPATNMAFDSLSFIFTGGIACNFDNLKTDKISNSDNFITLGYLLFGFPITHWLKSSFGFIPYSYIGYNIIDKQIVENVGKTDYKYIGSGGINQLCFNNAVKITKDFSLGISASYMFGKYDMARIVSFPDSIGLMSTKMENYFEVGDVYFDLGLLYKRSLGKNLTLGFGAIYGPSIKIKATENYIARTFFGSSAGIEIFRDTIEYRIEHEGNLIMPEKFGFGFTLKKTNKWLIGADYSWQNWNKFEAFDIRDSLDNSTQFSIGGEYLPTTSVIAPYWKKIKYRFGFRYNKTYLNLRNTRITEFGISFGMAFPIPRSLSTINFGIEFGNRGTTASGLIQENFIKFTVGIAIWERWFIKRKYN